MHCANRSSPSSRVLHAISPLRHVKPHGALYNDAHKNRALADVIIDAMRAIDPALAIVAPDRSQMAAAARAVGMNVICEAFADRRYEPDGSLTPRKRGRFDAFGRGGLRASRATHRGGCRHRPRRLARAYRFDTICVHADMDHAGERLLAIRRVVT